MILSLRACVLRNWSYCEATVVRTLKDRPHRNRDAANFQLLQSPAIWGFPGGSAGKESTCNVGDLGFSPWVGKIPWRSERLPTLVFWPGELYGLYSPQSHKESDTTERLSLSNPLSLPSPHSRLVNTEALEMTLLAANEKNASKLCPINPHQFCQR